MNALPSPALSMQESVFRLGVLGRNGNAIDYSRPPAEIRRAEKKLIGQITGIDHPSIVMLEQVHGDSIITVDRRPDGDLPWIGSADALITAIPGVCLVIRTADCVPVFLLDPVRRLIGAAHSGWRGCRLDITGALVRRMKRDYGCVSADLRAYIFPAIGKHSYEVSDDVAAFFPDDTVRRGGKAFVDLQGSVARSLSAEGIARERMTIAEECTLIRNDAYFSHRAGDIGRNLNFAFIECRQ